MPKNSNPIFPDINLLPDLLKQDVIHKISIVIHDSFTLPADEDYIAARFFAHRKMTRAFFWSASQAIEKYLKAFLLLRRISVNIKNGHDISLLYCMACNAEPNLENLKTTFHEKIIIDASQDDFLIKPNTKELIRIIAEHGTADNRYNASGVIFNTGYLFALDSFIHGLRNQIPGSRHYKITRSADDYLKSQFEYYNGWYSELELFPQIPNRDFTMIDSGACTMLDLLSRKHPSSDSIIVLQWLNAHMKLPNDIRSKLENNS